MTFAVEMILRSDCSRTTSGPARSSNNAHLPRPAYAAAACGMPRPQATLLRRLLLLQPAPAAPVVPSAYHAKRGLESWQAMRRMQAD